MTDVPVFVVGPPRSGTTLTARILDNHSAVFMPPETPFFEDIYARRRQLGDPATDPTVRRLIAERLKMLYLQYNNREQHLRIQRLFAETDLAARLCASQSYQEMMATFMTFRMRSAGKRRWGNNHPRDVFELRHIFALFPDAKVVVCVRNVLDFLASYREKWRRSERAGRDDNVERLRRLYHPVITSLLWRSSVRNANAAFQQWGDQMFLNRYEDMVQNPERQTHRLCDFIGESFEPTMVNVRSNNSSQDVPAEGIFTTSVGRWRTILTDSEAYVAQMICRNEMQQLGYMPAPVAPDVRTVIRYSVSAPIYGWRALAANSGRRGPTIPYLAKRILGLMTR